MKICHAFLFFSIKFAGGTSDLMYKICKAQIKQGQDPCILTGNHNFDQQLAETIPQVRFEVVKSYLDKEGFSIMPSLPFILSKEISGFDVVHMHVFRTFQNVLLYYYCKKHNVPYLVDAHGAVPYYHRKNRLKQLFDRLWGRRILQDAGLLIAETEVGVQEYLECDPSIPRKRIRVISPPFDTDEFEELPLKGGFRKKYLIDTSKKIIMFLGRVHHIKGNDFLIRGFAELCKMRDDVILAIVGSDDGHMDECKRLTKELRISEHVLFTGFIAGAEKNEALVDADIVAQMSRQEQGAWAPFEAVLCGTPIMVSRGTGSAEDVERLDAGELVTFGDIDDFVSAANNILSNYEAAKKRTLQAKAYIEENMSMNARSEEYIDAYNEAISNWNSAFNVH